MEQKESEELISWCLVICIFSVFIAALIALVTEFIQKMGWWSLTVFVPVSLFSFLVMPKVIKSIGRIEG